MIPVSPQFRDAVVSNNRRIVGRVTIDYTDITLDASIVATANEQVGSWVAQVSDALDEPTRRWASLDGSTLANGLSFPLPAVVNQEQMGWWGSSIAGAGGAFIAPFPTLTLSFASRPIRTLRVTGDSARGEFPVDFTVRLLGTGGVVLHTRSVTGNTLIDWQAAITSVSAVTQYVVEITRWSHAGRQVKVLEAFTSIQETYEGDDLFELNLLEEREVAQVSLPIGNISANEVTIRLNNLSRKFDSGNRHSSLFQLLKQNRRIRAWLGVELTPGGTVEYVPLGTFWSGEWHAQAEKVYASVTGRDRLEMLRKSTYYVSQVSVNQSLGALATAVLAHAGLTAADYWVDPALNTIIVPNAWLGTVSHREALRKIAEAALGQVYADRNGVVRIEGPAYLTAKEGFVSPFMMSDEGLPISPDNYFRKDTPVKWGELANRIEVETQPRLATPDMQEVYRSNAPVPIAAGQTVTMTVYYNESPVVDAVASIYNPPAGVAITAATYYAWGATVSVFKPSAGEFVLIVSGRPLRILNKARVVVEDSESVGDNGLLRYEYPLNDLVQTVDHAQWIANTLLALYRHPRRDLTMQWRGNPAVTLGDMVVVRDNDEWLRYWVIRQELGYAGALRARIEGRLVR